MEQIKYLNATKNSSRHRDEPDEFAVSYVPHKSGTYKIEISGPIEDTKQFSTAIQVLDNASEEDEVIIHLSDCPGGAVDAADSFLHSMMKCAAPIHVVAAGGTHSLSTHILLEADSFELAAGFSSLIHGGSTGNYGPVNEVRAANKFDEVFRERRFRECYEGFLTPSEIDDVLAGKDRWLDAEGWCERAIKRLEYFQQKLLDSQKPPKKPRVKKAKPAESLL